jgi:hypothetical protein
VDRVVEWEKEKYAIGYKNVTANDNFFNGHFPERAIMPGMQRHLIACSPSLLPLVIAHQLLSLSVSSASVSFASSGVGEKCSKVEWLLF